ncbi:MAG: hypothetical protein QNK23_08185 [Crocinitomicaceae bacterium]|nr:hypothetical protein [Crocinitomicaceae bacterium]
MENYGFELTINGENCGRAGFESKHYVLSIIMLSMRVNHTGEDEASTYLTVGGVNSDKGARAEWLTREGLTKGDKVSLKVIEGPFDASKPLQFSKEEMQLQHKKSMYRQLKAELEELGDI